MPKFARKKSPPNVTAPVATRFDAPDAITEEGGAGFTRDAKSELFLLALTNMVGEATFYEAARDRDRRYAALIKDVAASDPAWIARFVPFLRQRTHVRGARQPDHGAGPLRHLEQIRQLHELRRPVHYCPELSICLPGGFRP